MINSLHLRRLSVEVRQCASRQNRNVSNAY
jgi:hypothetical protein